MPSADWYRRKADECVALAKGATINKERARHWAVAEHYMQLSMDELKDAEASKPIHAFGARRKSDAAPVGRNEPRLRQGSRQPDA